MRSRFKAERPLHIVVVDHTKIDAIVIDARRQPLGRPWLTIAIDVFSRMATGFHLALTPPSRISVSMCLLQSVCGKRLWLSDRGVEEDWPVAGMPEILRLDPQSFFGLRGFGRVCANMKIQTICKNGGEHKFGAHIQSLIGSRIGNIALLTDQEEAGREAERSEVVLCGGLAELERHIARQIVHRYHFQRHPALRRSPISVWRENESSVAFRAPANCMNFRLSFMPEEECEVRNFGVVLQGRTYWSQLIRKLQEDGVVRAVVKFDPRDMSKVFVRTPSGRYVKAFENESAEYLLAGGKFPSPLTERTAILRSGVSYALQKLRLNRLAAETEVGPAIGFGNVSQIERRCAASCPFAAGRARRSAGGSLQSC